MGAEVDGLIVSFNGLDAERAHIALDGIGGLVGEDLHEESKDGLAET